MAAWSFSWAHSSADFHWIESSSEKARAKAWVSHYKVALADFLSFWEQRGVSFPSSKVQFFIQPNNDETTAKDYMERRFGATWQQQMGSQINTLSGLTHPQALHPLLVNLDGTFSPLLVDAFAQLERLEKFSEKELRDHVAQVLKKGNRLLRLSDADTQPWPNNNLAYGFYEYRGSQADSYLILNRSPRPDVAQDGFDYPEVVFHEVGHGFHYDLWQSQGDYPIDQGFTDSTVNELVADLFSHVYLQTDGCHRRKKPGSSPFEAECSRRMDVNDSLYPNLFEELTASLFAHDGADNVRAFLWSVYQELGREEFSVRLVQAVQKMENDLRSQQKRFADTKWWKDPFLNTYRGIAYPHEVIARFTENICTQPVPQSCAQREKALGEFDHALLANFLKHAPTVAMENGKKWNLLHPADQSLLSVEFGQHAFSAGSLETALWVTDHGVRIPFRMEGPRSMDPTRGFVTFSHKGNDFEFVYLVSGEFEMHKPGASRFLEPAKPIQEPPCG